jgi:hypothetical protein
MELIKLIRTESLLPFLTDTTLSQHVSHRLSDHVRGDTVQSELSVHGI